MVVSVKRRQVVRNSSVQNLGMSFLPLVPFVTSFPCARPKLAACTQYDTFGHPGPLLARWTLPSALRRVGKDAEGVVPTRLDRAKKARGHGRSAPCAHPTCLTKVREHTCVLRRWRR